MRKFLAALALVLLWATPLTAQVTAPNTFTAGTTIKSADVNANFAMLADCLNRTGGTMTGNLVFGVDNTKDIGASGATRPRRGYFGTEVKAPLFTGALTGNVTGTLTGNVTGDVTGNLTGNMTGDVTGNVSGSAGSVTNGVLTTSTYADPAWITSLSIAKVATAVSTGGSYADPAWITSLAGAKVSGAISGASGSTTGNAATVTDGVYTTGSYANPTWITSLAAAKITGLATGGKVVADVTSASTSGTGEDTIATLTIPGATLAAAGDSIRIAAIGTMTGTAGNKTVKLKYGGTTVCTVPAANYSAGYWMFDVTIVEVSGTAQFAMGTFATPTGIITVLSCAGAAPAETVSGNVSLVVTGEVTDGGDAVVSKAVTVQVIR
jgi:hypothetical protein